VLFIPLIPLHPASPRLHTSLRCSVRRVLTKEEEEVFVRVIKCLPNVGLPKTNFSDPESYDM